MKAILPLFVFIDACGWEIIKNDPFGRKFAPRRKRLTSVFGYSSTCVPSILSGQWPAQHRNWSYFVYDPANSPFKALRRLRWLPRAITSRRIFRRWLPNSSRRNSTSAATSTSTNSFEYISLYELQRKEEPALQPGGMNRGPNIFDYLEKNRIAYHVSAPRFGRRKKISSALMSEIDAERIDFRVSLWPGLDGLLHREAESIPGGAGKLRVL